MQYEVSRMQWQSQTRTSKSSRLPNANKPRKRPKRPIMIGVWRGGSWRNQMVGEKRLEKVCRALRSVVSQTHFPCAKVCHSQPALTTSDCNHIRRFMQGMGTVCNAFGERCR